MDRAGTARFSSREETENKLAAAGYLAGPSIATVVYLASTLDKPLLVEGPAGVGKARGADNGRRVHGGARAPSRESRGA